MKRLAAALFAAALVLVGPGSSRAAEPAHTTFSPAPPGTIVQNQLAYLAGDGMHSQWRTVLSRKLLGRSGGTAYYQYYLSIYAIDGNVYHLRYQSPTEKIPFDTVTKPQGAPRWFPLQDAKIVGAGEFMGPGAQQVVVQSHATGADCGSARVDVFFFDAAMHRIMTTLSVENPCDLQATIVHEKGGVDALRLTGPYYAKNAAMCCPTKAKASALLRFVNGKGVWKETPRYFTILKTP